MSLMMAYHCFLQIWGTLWGLLSLGFIVGGLVVAREAWGKSSKNALLANTIMWIYNFLHDSGIHRTLAIGLFIYLCLIPVVASEQTILPSFRLNVRVACLV